MACDYARTLYVHHTQCAYDMTLLGGRICAVRIRRTFLIQIAYIGRITGSRVEVAIDSLVLDETDNYVFKKVPLTMA